MRKKVTYLILFLLFVIFIFLCFKISLKSEVLVEAYEIVIDETIM